MAKKKKIIKAKGTIIVYGIPTKKTVRKIAKLASYNQSVPEYGKGAITYYVDIMSILCH